MIPRLVPVFLCAAVLSAAEESPKSVEAKEGHVRRSLKRKGTFVPAEGAVLAVDLEVYKTRGLDLTDVVPHGRFVNEGDVLARFDREDYVRKLEEARLSFAEAELKYEHGKVHREMALQKTAERLAKAELEAERAAKRLEGYKKHALPIKHESERLAKKSRQYRLDDQRDELEQLEKMYGEDELVDATEEIVLKRSRRNFARAVASTKLTERRLAYRKEYYESWELEDHERNVRLKRAALERTRRAARMERAQAGIDAKQAAYRLRRQSEQLEELEKDGERLVVRAPRRGLVLHGELEGPWNARHEEGDKVAPGKVFLSVADPKKFAVKTTVEEADLRKLKANTAAVVTPTFAEDLKLAGRLAVEYLPEKPGVFPARIELGDSSVRLRPGLTGEVEVVLAEERGVVVVPLAAVKRDGDRATVRVADEAGGPFREVEVVTGLDDGEHVAIRDGVTAGQHVAVGQ